MSVLRIRETLPEFESSIFLFTWPSCIIKLSGATSLFHRGNSSFVFSCRDHKKALLIAVIFIFKMEGDGTNDDGGKRYHGVMKEQALKHLPVMLRQMLFLCDKRLAEEASTGDSCASTEDSRVPTISERCGDPAKLKEILTKKLESLSENSSIFQSENTQQASKKENESDICYFHRKFGLKAYKCTKWCKLNNVYRLRRPNNV